MVFVFAGGRHIAADFIWVYKASYAEKKRNTEKLENVTKPYDHIRHVVVGADDDPTWVHRILVHTVGRHGVHFCILKIVRLSAKPLTLSPRPWKHSSANKPLVSNSLSDISSPNQYLVIVSIDENATCLANV